MAAAVERAWPHVKLSGTVVTPHGHRVDTQRIHVREAGHPVPDANSVAAANEILSAVRGLAADDLVLALMSGGGSSTLCLPAAGLTLEDKQSVNRTLLASGLDIRTMNAVRKRISGIKGGKLALAAAPARVFTLAISDIPGDDPTAIASGPTVVDPSASLDLSDVAARLGTRLPKRVTQLLTASPNTTHGPTDAPIKLIASPAAALHAAADIARAAGVTPVILGDDIEGESRSVGTSMAAVALKPVERATVFISGGETTVTLNQCVPGRGGRNTEFLLSLVFALDGAPNIWAIAADTDGEDGANLGAAGAIAAPSTIARARGAGLDPVTHLASHDSGSFFEALGDLVTTGPTRTNVNDFRAILVLPAATAHGMR
jgi:hydroxypyruvate reductase